MQRGFGGMAPTPEQMERIRQAQAIAQTEVEESGGIPQVALRNEAYPDGVTEGNPLDLRSEIDHMIRGLHWKHQKQIFDIVQAAIGANSAHWQVVRKLIMDVSTAQVETTAQLVRARLRKEIMKEGNGDVGIRFERRAEGDQGSGSGSDPVAE